MRTFLERISRRRSFVRHLPANLGGLPIIVSPDAQLKYLKPGPKGFDRTLLEAAVRLVRPGDNVWDVGANVGVFSVAAAALSQTGQIVAIEADIWLAGLLSRTARLPANGVYNISVLPVAAFSTAGVASFAIAARGR
ncbi:MAG: FkbM family methyltransferase, partial [Alphaproteobacteria bacterium HGW-Alphaproteobacteria-5]